MPNIGVLHPQVVHFAIALLFAGVVLRWIFLTGRAAWTGPAAATLILAGTLAAVAANRSGTDAHGPVERVPGSDEAVREHEWWGGWTRNVFLAVALIEAAGLVLARSGRQRPAAWASAAVGLAGLLCLYQAAAHGGTLVYSYAGGVGIRSGAPEDVGRLLLAGLYHQAQADRKAGRAEDAAALFETAARRFPSDAPVQLAAAESLLLDRKDPAAAIAVLGKISPPKEDRRLRLRHGLLTADALEAAGQKEGAMALLQSLRAEFPDNARLKKRIEQAGGAK